MENRRFNFVGNINGKRKELIVHVSVENNGVYTNKYCPQDLLTGGVSFVTPVHGEILNEFIADCQKQVIAMEAAGLQATSLDAHIAGLMAVIMDHLVRCGRLIFGDLLIYMDCFSLLLEADGFSDKEIRGMYPRVTRAIIELYPDKVFNTMDLSPFKGSHFDFILSNVTRK